MRLLVFAFLATGALANPQGGTVVSGTAAISVSGKTLTVNQTTDRAILNWQRAASSSRAAS